jgi:alpha-glucosidase (family GH31 glycosyl hydrolase)
MEAFSGSMFRSHVGSLFRDKDAQVWDDDVLPGFAKFTQVFAFLKDYRHAAMKVAEKKGWPVVRSGFLAWGSGDDRVWEEDFIRNEFMFGDDFLVAPVVAEGAEDKTVYFPLCGDEGGTWVHLWTQDTYACGDEQKVEAPVGEPPVFYLQGSDWGGKLAEFVQTLA